MSGVYSDEENSKVFSQRSKSKKKKGLPLVGSKDKNFEMSKMDVIGKFDAGSIGSGNNIRSTNFGVNGVKIGDKIIE